MCGLRDAKMRDAAAAAAAKMYHPSCALHAIPIPFPATAAAKAQPARSDASVPANFAANALRACAARLAQRACNKSVAQIADGT